MEAFAIRDLTFSYPTGGREALSGVSLAVREGEFLVLCGASGSGKTTLLRCLKPGCTPHGVCGGEIVYFGEPLAALDARRAAAEIGFVRQSPEDQLVTEKVYTELAFGLESLGVPAEEMRRRVAETAAFFGMEPWLRRGVSTLSGGQKQLLNLASVMALRPRVLLLDEPTAQLDPIAAGEFLAALGRLNRELGTTIVLSEHRLDDALSFAARAAVLERGRLLCAGTPAGVGETLRASGHPMLSAMSAATRIWAGLDAPPPCPVTVPEGRELLARRVAGQACVPLPPEAPDADGEDLLAARELWFRYERAGEDVLRGASLTLRRGETLAVLGGNGAGKTTLLRVLAGAAAPLRGRVERRGRVALLPQDPRMLFTQTSVRDELSGEAAQETIRLCELGDLLDRHPYDLSGGEQQRLALAKLLLTKPDVLLLDEPTKGLDAAYKRRLARLLAALRARGVSSLLVSHDVEFCAVCAQRCALLFDGQIEAAASPRVFFSGNYFYTTAARRVARGFVPDAVTVSEVLLACGARPESEPPDELPLLPPDSSPDRQPPQTAPPRAPLPKRTRLAIALDVLLIPLTLLLGLRLLGNGGGFLTAVLVLLEAMLPFFLAFEGRRPPARELVILAVLCALGVAGRAAFFMLQQFKPVIALVIVAGVAFGGEAGFLVGAVTMLVSNMLFGQGPWTPFQMFAMGMIGLLAGLLHEGGLLPPRRVPLCVFGAAAALVIYGGLMNPAAALLSTRSLSGSSLLAFYAAGLPMDLVQAAATVLFLALAGEAMLEKLLRVRLKYGI